MPASILFWGIMLLWLIFGALSLPRPFAWRASLPQLLLFILLALLGWKEFGPAVQ